MNYIKKLQLENREVKAELYELQKGLNEFKRYLLSDKFHTDTTVQVNDVLHRLREIQNNATDAMFNVE